jgi:hypothetical protein
MAGCAAEVARPLAFGPVVFADGAPDAIRASDAGIHMYAIKPLLGEVPVWRDVSFDWVADWVLS